MLDIVGTNLGTRCLGHGTNPNNCGHDRTKLNIWGKKNKSNVFEKWPCIPTTEKAIPVT